MTPSCGWIAARGQYQKITVVKKKSTEEKTHRMSKVWPFIWVLSLDYDFGGIWGLSR